MKKIITAISFIFTISILIVVLFLFRYNNFKQMPVVSENHIFVVEPGSNATLVANNFLELSFENKVYRSLFFRQYTQYTVVKTGHFEVKQGWNLIELFDHLTNGNVVQQRITFIEGTTFKEWRSLVKDYPHLIDDTADLSEAEVATLIKSDKPKLEGLLLPETYFYTNGTKVSVLYKQAHGELIAYLAQAWETRAKDLPLKSAYEALILASIIEKETAVESERTTVASVFVNRLNKRMRLQTDPTVIYGLGDRYKGDIRYRHLREKTAYNTYVIKRLPPTPIAMVSKSSIDAALHPADTKYLYFVASGNGAHYFSKTLAEHNRAVKKYILKR